jgi:23S rRNA pseudouridine1911/1915/1917 synthase
MELKNNIDIIFNDKNIIIAKKPAGMPCQADKTGDTDMLAFLSESFSSEIFLVHRLDRPIGGIMVFAKNKKSCASLSEQIREKTFKKTYLAVVCGTPQKSEDTLIDYIIKNQRLNLSKSVHKNTPGAKTAELSYKIIDTIETDDFGSLSLLKVDLKTGRHHQIRLQLSNAGFPIWGDTKYNVALKRHGYVKTALFSSSIEFTDPATNKLVKYEISPPDEFPFNIFKETPITQ